MDRTKLISIRKENWKKKLFTKNEIKYFILKSIVQNRMVAPLIRVKAAKILQSKPKMFFISKQKNNICLKTGRIKGVYNQFNLSRHTLKFFGMNNNLQNVKIASW